MIDYDSCHLQPGSVAAAFPADAQTMTVVSQQRLPISICSLKAKEVYKTRAELACASDIADCLSFCC